MDPVFRALQANRPVLVVGLHPATTPTPIRDARGWAMARSAPFRAPHWSCSLRALEGVESRPGELELAGEGLLVLSDAHEFSPAALRSVAINRWSSGTGRRTRIVALVPDLDAARRVRAACPIRWSIVQ